MAEEDIALATIRTKAEGIEIIDNQVSQFDSLYWDPSIEL